MTVVEDYQGQTEALAGGTAASVLGIYTAMQAGGVAPAVAVPAIAAVIATANAAATTLADLGVAAQIEAATGIPQPPNGIAPRDDTERLTKAVETIIGEPAPEPENPPEPVPEVRPEPAAEVQPEPVAVVHPEPAPEPVAEVHPEPAPEPENQPEPGPDETANRLERLARSEPLDTGQAITVEIINRIPVVKGWTRKLDADPCARCVRWAEDGRVFHPKAHFKRHFGCNCQQEVVTTTEGKSA